MNVLKKGKKDGAGENVSETVTKSAVIISRVLIASTKLLQGDDVVAVHTALLKHGLHVGEDSVNGAYGAATAVAVRHFQARSGLIVDGIVGKQTAAALGLEWSDTPEK